MEHATGPAGIKAGTLAVAAALLLPLQARAEEPKGSITISRTLPPRNAIRHDGSGPALRVATAREDVVVAATRFETSSIGALPDLALAAIAARPDTGQNPSMLPPMPAMQDVRAANTGMIGKLVAGSTVPQAVGGLSAAQAGIADGLRALPSLGDILAPAMRTGASK